MMFPTGRGEIAQIPSIDEADPTGSHERHFEISECYSVRLGDSFQPPPERTESTLGRDEEHRAARPHGKRPEP